MPLQRSQLPLARWCNLNRHRRLMCRCRAVHLGTASRWTVARIRPQQGAVQTAEARPAGAGDWSSSCDVSAAVSGGAAPADPGGGGGNAQRRRRQQPARRRHQQAEPCAGTGETESECFTFWCVLTGLRCIVWPQVSLTACASARRPHHPHANPCPALPPACSCHAGCSGCAGRSRWCPGCGRRCWRWSCNGRPAVPASRS